MPQQFGPLYDVFRQIKRLFDRQNILNPGKKVADAPQPVTANLRPVVASQQSMEHLAENAEPRTSPAFPVPLQLTWPAVTIDHAARMCNGCGYCRSQLPDERMCPIFRYGPREEATPRTKANLMRAIITGRLAPSELEGDELKRHC